MMRNQIYYLLDLHKKCSLIITYDDIIINKFYNVINYELHIYFSVEEQQNLKLYNFNYAKMYQFVYGDIDDICFYGLDNNKLCQFFDKITYI